MHAIRAAFRGGPAAAGLATLGLALLVASAIKREPPDFAALPVIAIVRDADQRPLWAVRLAPTAHEIAVDSLGPGAPPQGQLYHLWFAAPEGARSLGLLPASGRKVIAEIPALAARLAGKGELIVTLEPAHGPDMAQPSGPVVFRAAFPGAG